MQSLLSWVKYIYSILSKTRQKYPCDFVKEKAVISRSYLCFILFGSGVYNFEFLDNDIIGNDFQYFGDLLSLLVSIRESYALFSIKMAEIITKNMPWKMIKQMRIANFENVQIGYESPSEQLLSLISKKNTFASNLFFLKWAIEFGIGVSGANVIRNLLEERKEHM